MINSTSFNYIDVLDKASDASWTRESLIANNIANVDTVGYKRQDINFESVLQKEIGHSKFKSLDDRINSIDMNKLNPSVYTDSSNYSYRMDGNNVDIDSEQVELASEQIKYKTLAASISSEFSRMKTAMGR
ncbi:MAG: flagellar basal body rod protein FlgB [Agathobacter sp.]|nr:flagellar basal body rod protein FlgB [Agathobacter sp.]